MNVAFFNLSGRVPEPEDFEGLSGKSPRERREMGLAEREDLIDGADIQFDPPVYLQQVSAVQRRRVLNAHAEFRCVAWVTHVAVRRRGRFYVRKIEAAPVKPGSTIDFGFTEPELATWQTDEGEVVICSTAWAVACRLEVESDHTRRIDIES
jgi:hypothetical protein